MSIKITISQRNPIVLVYLFRFEDDKARRGIQTATFEFDSGTTMIKLILVSMFKRTHIALVQMLHRNNCSACREYESPGIQFPNAHVFVCSLRVTVRLSMD